MLLIYSTTDITASVARGAGDAHPSGAPDLTPRLMGVCDVRLLNAININGTATAQNVSMHTIIPSP